MQLQRDSQLYHQKLMMTKDNDILLCEPIFHQSEEMNTGNTMDMKRFHIKGRNSFLEAFSTDGERTKTSSSKLVQSRKLLSRQLISFSQKTKKSRMFIPATWASATFQPAPSQKARLHPSGKSTEIVGGMFSSIICYYCTCSAKSFISYKRL